MSNPIIECVNATGLTVYAAQINRLTGEWWNTSGTPAWEAFNAAHWADYAVALTEAAGSGYYWAARPAGVAGALVSDVFYSQAGGSPAIGDAPPFNLLHGEGENVAAIDADPAVAPQNLAAAVGTEIQGTVAAGTITNTAFPTNVTGYTNNLLVGRTLIFLTGTLAKAAVPILSYNGSTGVIGVGPLVGAPTVADTFLIV
ncbi:MAG: hypothetical protein PHS14_00135 [Elusimicrobia bacterium]|nr:hypothetical protein [Elusimicrobiota bacterium]